MKPVFITGTDTDVGKTWVSCQLIETLYRANIDVMPFKPIASGISPHENENDGYKLAKAANRLNELPLINPFTFKQAISPALAAHYENQPIFLETLYQCYEKLPKPYDLCLVEGAGGFYSPLCTDGSNADLASQLKADIILVVKDRLGCINHTLLSIDAIEKHKLGLVAIVLNQVNHTPNDMNNLMELKGLTHYPVFETNELRDLADLLIKTSLHKS